MLLLEIYRSMLTAAKDWCVPKKLELGFTFNEEETKRFWDKNNQDETDRQILLDEWEMEPNNRYTKILYGRMFFIQFTYKNNP